MCGTLSLVQNKNKVHELAVEHGVRLKKTLEVPTKQEHGRPPKRVLLEVERPLPEIVADLRALGAL